jgi:L-lactate dehydrogenase complex protein LldF
VTTFRAILSCPQFIEVATRSVRSSSITWGNGDWPHRSNLTNAPEELAKAARLHLRERFLTSEVGISGANFLIAETGSIAIVESEGNGRMCLTLPNTLISIAGIDKVIPRFEDLDVFFQVLPRSATGERMNPYNSLWTGVSANDGPQNFHVVLLDNGRSNALGDRVGRDALRCIRCAACLNVCPVYEQVGGHAYGSVYPGPIGAILTPQLDHVATDEVAKSLPYASTLCGACFDACPVRIDIPKLLVHLRGEIVNAERGILPKSQEQAAMRGASWIFASAKRLRAVSRVGAIVHRLTRGRQIPLPWWLGGWSAFRTTPTPSEPSFTSWWLKERGESVPVSSPPTVARPSVHTMSDPHALGIRSKSLPSTSRRSDARSSILNAIAASNAHQPQAPVVPRTYRRPARAHTMSKLELFTQRVSDYQAAVSFATPSTLAASIGGVLSSRNSQSVVIPFGLPRDWMNSFTGDLVVDDQLDVATLDAIHAVVTGCTAGIAETGTVVLNSDVDQGRRVISLIPDHHVVVIRESQIVDDVPDVTALLDPMRPQTWISGPSATSDIELNRVEGVHGPRKLDVIIVREHEDLD